MSFRLENRLDTDTETLETAAAVYGAQMQAVVAVEEMAELTKELCKFQRGGLRPEKLAEELADVELLLAQLRILFGNAEAVEKWKAKKLLRLRERMGI